MASLYQNGGGGTSSMYAGLEGSYGSVPPSTSTSYVADPSFGTSYGTDPFSLYGSYSYASSVVDPLFSTLKRPGDEGFPPAIELSSMAFYVIHFAGVLLN